MRKHSFSSLGVLLLLALILISCGSRKKLVYFQGEEDSVQLEQYYELKIEPGDILSIDITGTDHDVAKPYNQAEMVRQGNQAPTYDNGVPVSYGYLVSSDSTISLPIVGKVLAGGKTRNELVADIEETVKAYIDKPQVSVRLMNFKVTVLGEVENPGTFNVPNERITIIEAIGVAKDLKITGERSNILVIRNENGEKKEYRVDLTSKDVFSSPAYYLKQNDVVYVEPNSKSRYDSTLLRSAGNVIISATSLIISTIILITK